MKAAAGGDDYLEVDYGQAAIAAAALLAAARRGESVLDGPDELPAAQPELLALGVRALDRVIGEESEWCELWEETDDVQDALARVAEVRSALV